MYASSFFPLVTKPTKIADKTVTLIDNTFVNNTNKFSKRGILISDLLDHLTIFYITKQQTEPKISTEKHTIQIINEKSMNKLIEEMSKEKSER